VFLSCLREFKGKTQPMLCWPRESFQIRETAAQPALTALRSINPTMP
jgi:hypothetical protein